MTLKRKFTKKTLLYVFQAPVNTAISRFFLL